MTSSLSTAARQELYCPHLLSEICGQAADSRLHLYIENIYASFPSCCLVAPLMTSYKTSIRLLVFAFMLTGAVYSGLAKQWRIPLHEQLVMAYVEAIKNVGNSDSSVSTIKACQSTSRRLVDHTPYLILLEFKPAIKLTTTMKIYLVSLFFLPFSALLCWLRNSGPPHLALPVMGPIPPGHLERGWRSIRYLDLRDS